MYQKQKSKQGKKHTTPRLSDQHRLLLAFLEATSNKMYTYSKLVKHFKGKLSKAFLQEALVDLVAQGAIERRERGKFTVPLRLDRLPEVIGKVDYVNSGYAYIVVGDGKPDIWVQQSDLNGALDGDMVKVVILPQGKQVKKHPIGKVVAIVEKGKRQWVGIMQRQKSSAFVIITDRRMHYDLFIQPENLKNAQHNDRVVVTLTKLPTASKNPEGKITKVLGPMGQHDVEIHAIMEEFNLPEHFPQKILAVVNELSMEVGVNQMANRKDFREVFTMTIDPDDAKDFDDALSLRNLPNGHVEIGVHIADVSHYVQPDSLIDQEAYERGTSVYLVDRVIPMLPERLSNEICSLKPHEDRLAFSIVFELDMQGVIHQEWVGETVIHSNQRMTYEEAQEAIRNSEHALHTSLTTLNTIAKKLRANRLKQGAINFDTPSIKFKLDKEGRPLSILPKVSQDSHRLVEEFMLLANRRVAWRVQQMKQGQQVPTFIYRIHDQPHVDRLENFSLFVKQFGYAIKTNPQEIAQSINTLSEDLANHPASHIIQTLAIRMMAKALYTTEAKPHFGLAFEHYTHFTSPIRRYPDLMVHRLLKQYLQGNLSFEATSYEKKCQHTSDRERVAAEAERASIKYKQVELMQALQGKTLKGIISSLTEWGMYVELLEILCEGMIRLSDLKDDYYVLEKNKFKLIGERTQKTYCLGDEIMVTIKACDLVNRTVDLFPVE
eukprot:gene169-224_t